MLELREIYAGYGPLDVLRDISLEVQAGEMVSIIGANGAGKSTLLKAISGLLPCHRGSIRFQGQEIARTPAEKVVGLGLIQVPEGRQVFAPLTVYENLLLGCYSRYDRLGRKGRDQLLEVAYQRFPILAERRQQRAGTLSGGEQQMLAIARGLMGQPRLLLLDEPSLGLAPLMVKEVARVLEELNRAGLTILLVEQNALIALSLAQRAYVLEHGSLVLEGPSAELLHNDKVREIYLGETELSVGI